MIDKAGVQLKAMILPGINCGMGNHDCATLPLSVLDLKTAWLDFGRTKTGIERGCRLWPETIASLQAVLARRHEPKEPEHANKVFVTKYGFPWLSKGKTKRDNPITKETAKLLKALKFTGRASGSTLSVTHQKQSAEVDVRPLLTGDVHGVDAMMPDASVRVRHHHRGALTAIDLLANIRDIVYHQKSCQSSHPVI